MNSEDRWSLRTHHSAANHLYNSGQLPELDYLFIFFVVVVLFFGAAMASCCQGYWPNYWSLSSCTPPTCCALGCFSKFKQVVQIQTRTRRLWLLESNLHLPLAAPEAILVPNWQTLWDMPVRPGGEICCLAISQLSCGISSELRFWHLDFNCFFFFKWY